MWSGRTFWRPPCPSTSGSIPTAPSCRLKGAYLIRCTGCVKDETGRVVEILATYDPESSGGNPADGRKVKGATIHWVNAADALDAEVRLYDNLFTVANPEEGNFLDYLNPDSLKVLTGCKVEKSLGEAKPGRASSSCGRATSAPTTRTLSRDTWCSTAL